MATTFSVAESEDSEAFEMSLAQKMAQNYSLATLVALIVWFIFAPQCVSTIAILKRETGGWKWTSLMLSYTTVMALCFFIYCLSSHKCSPDEIDLKFELTK